MSVSTSHLSVMRYPEYFVITFKDSAESPTTKTVYEPRLSNNTANDALFYKSNYSDKLGKADVHVSLKQQTGDEWTNIQLI